MPNERVLVVDDDASTRLYLCRFLGSRGYFAKGLDSGEQVVGSLSAADRPSVVLLDLIMPRIGGLEVLSQMQILEHFVPVIVMSAEGRTRTVVRAMRLGAVDYLVKPFKDEELERALRDALDVEPARPRPARPAASGHTNLFETAGADPRIARIRDIASRVADTDVPVLILGETGVGKEVLARYIHDISNRSSEPFVKINCAALPADLLESELFGYERGAFTGAIRDKPGKFELAGQGTLLLDEIAEMSSALQAKLLHVLQDGEWMRLGGTRTIRSRARILAATNRRLEEAVAKGAFRQDLFYRLNVVRIEIPPLRSRQAEIPRLCQQFLDKYQVRYGRDPVALPQEVMDAFCQYSWPGNVRQLENIIRRFVILLDPEAVLADLYTPRVQPAPPHQNSPSRIIGTAHTSLREVSAQVAEQVEREAVLRILQEVNWNRKEAARRLNICYKSLLQKLHRWSVPDRINSARASSHAAAG